MHRSLGDRVKGHVDFPVGIFDRPGLHDSPGARDFDRGQQVHLVPDPEAVFVEFLLVDHLVAREVEPCELLTANTGSCDPVIFHLKRVEALVMINDQKSVRGIESVRYQIVPARGYITPLVEEMDAKGVVIREWKCEDYFQPKGHEK